jgi:hypothetical protein
LHSTHLFDTIESNYSIIDVPIKMILLQNIPVIRQIGRSSSVVHTDLLEKIGKSDNSVYTHNMSLSLRCAKYSKFVYIRSPLSTVYKSRYKLDSSFKAYNNLKSIYNFVKSNPELFKPFISELLYALSVESLNKRSKLKYFIHSWINRYMQLMNLNRVLKLYQQEFDKLF